MKKVKIALYGILMLAAVSALMGAGDAKDSGKVPASAPDTGSKTEAKAAAPSGTEAPSTPVPATVGAIYNVDASAQPDPTGQDSMETLTRKIAERRRTISGLEGKILERTKQVKALLETYERAEKNLTGFNGLGRIEQMEFKADLYAGERIARKKIGEEFANLENAINQWESSKRTLAEDMSTLALKKEIVDLKVGAEDRGSSMAAQVNAQSPKALMNIEYYQVKKAADLRTISADPEVYGTPDFWEYLYKANKDMIPDPNKPVPAGTTLVVPQDVKRLPDFSDL